MYLHKEEWNVNLRTDNYVWMLFKYFDVKA